MKWNFNFPHRRRVLIRKIVVESIDYDDTQRACQLSFVTHKSLWKPSSGSWWGGK